MRGGGGKMREERRGVVMGEERRGRERMTCQG